MEFYERVSGARMHAAYNRPSKFFTYNLDNQLLIDILSFISGCYTTLNEMHNILTYIFEYFFVLFTDLTFNLLLSSSGDLGG